VPENNGRYTTNNKTIAGGYKCFTEEVVEKQRTKNVRKQNVKQHNREKGGKFG
jgi:hypothetical protein